LRFGPCRRLFSFRSPKCRRLPSTASMTWPPCFFARLGACPLGWGSPRPIFFSPPRVEGLPLSLSPMNERCRFFRRFFFLTALYNWAICPAGVSSRLSHLFFRPRPLLVSPPPLRMSSFLPLPSVGFVESSVRALLLL